MFRATPIVLTAAFILSACGGGGGSSSDNITTVTPPPNPQVSARDQATQQAKENFDAMLAAAQQEADNFMAQNGQNSDVTVLASGLQFKIIRNGETSGVSPTLSQSVKVHYEGSLIDGTIFDSSYEGGRPAEFAMSELIPGWQEGMTQLRPGDEVLLFIPPALAYGAEGKGASIPPNAALIFRVDLLDIL